MKRLFALLIVLVLGLSLCACGSDNNKGSEMTKDEMLNIAKKFDYSDFQKKAEENILQAEELYLGNVYKIEGFVSKIEHDLCVLRFLSSSDSLEGYVNVPLQSSELMQLKINERILVVGEICEIRDSFIKLSSAYYLGNEFEATVRVWSLVYASASDDTPKYAISSFKGFLDNNVAPLCDIYLDGNTLAKLKEDDEITVVGKFNFYSSENVHLHYNQKILFEITDAKLSNE